MINKKSFISLVLAFCLIVPAMFMLSACSKSNDTAVKHNYSEEWSVDAEYHWHACTDENCNAVNHKAKHSFDSDEKCTVCQKSKFNFSINIGDDPISADIKAFQQPWLNCPDSEYTDVNSYYTIEYFKYENDTTLTSIGEDFPTEAGRYQVKVTFDGDKIYLPAQATADFTIAE